jgi:hypothetical protein
MATGATAEASFPGPAPRPLRRRMQRLTENRTTRQELERVSGRELEKARTDGSAFGRTAVGLWELPAATG